MVRRQGRTTTSSEITAWTQGIEQPVDHFPSVSLCILVFLRRFIGTFKAGGTTWTGSPTSSLFSTGTFPPRILYGCFCTCRASASPRLLSHRSMLCLPSHSGHGRREILDNSTSLYYHFPPVREPGGRHGTMCRLAGGDLGDQEPSTPSALSWTLKSPCDVTVATVVVGQVNL